MNKSGLRHGRGIAAAIMIVGVNCLGCGSGVVPVTGSVSLDGQPLAGAYVSFKPADGGRPQSIPTDEAGRFDFGVASVGGLPVADYLVTVVKTEVTGLPPGGPDATAIPADFDASQIRERWVTPQRYAKANTSGLTASVESGMPPLVFELVSD